MVIDKGNNMLQWVGFGLISLFVLTVYSPSLMDGPRADQLGYLAELEVEHKTSLWDLTIGSMDLHRHRILYPGDEVLFRPVLFLVLGAEVYFFGFHYLYWQAFGIFLHLMVIWSLLKLLLAIYSGWEAVSWTAFFALLFVDIEMVIWQHINTYMIFVICVLAALRYFYILITQKDSKTNNYIFMSLWLLLGAFSHEMANAIALILGLFLWAMRPRQRLWTLCVFAVPAIYLTADIADLVLRPCKITLYGHSNFSQIFSDWFLIAGHWLYTGIFPFEFQWLYGPRTVIAAKELYLIKPLHLWFLPTACGLALIITYEILLFKNRRRFWALEHTISLLVLIFIGLLVTAIDLGRGGQHPILQVLHINTYYMYIFWAFLVPGLYALIDWPSVTKGSKYILCILAGVFILINSLKLYNLNEKIALKNLKDLGLSQRVSAVQGRPSI